MTQYDNTDRGVLFKNDRKETDNHPDYKGQINVAGEEFWLSAWIKDGQKGKFMSLSVKPKEVAPQQTRAPVRQAVPATRGRPSPNFSDMDDDIPF
jgi:hypothetical protein